jgi:predicted phosphoadenosine phosphosulfate sulfurtransferase
MSALPGFEPRTPRSTEEAMTNEPQRCIRCHSTYTTAPHIMAGRKFCCASCAVGSACEHQGVRRSESVRRYDAMFDRFRQVATENTPYETDVERSGP